jgi:hypothetical protein
MQGQPIDRAREHMAEEALKANAKYLFFLDSDTLIEPDTISRLASHNVPIVSALYYRRHQPQFPEPMILQSLSREEQTRQVAKYLAGQPLTTPAMWKLHEIKKGRKKVRGYIPILDGQFPMGKLVECDAIGLGACLIRTDVFKRIPKPWFRWTLGWLEYGCSEDFYFCEVAKKAGYRLLVDTSTLARHEASMFVGANGVFHYAEI